MGCLSGVIRSLVLGSIGGAHIFRQLIMFSKQNISPCYLYMLWEISVHTCEIASPFHPNFVVSVTKLTRTIFFESRDFMFFFSYARANILDRRVSLC